ncbi:MAG: hypothetical protein A2289_07690 [Deltaproteobacteria bacterium RIFOXYA12_FULL_58_15]|nr:MAG: hypothetical protein A2289_07690 [Deltaproteobacteria bacterium RIFOXYA12_FULL_58_15]OGR09620.1 MAG: hypothetical protein A2341_00405 [Deltaproteobacteria bacterium RIFOXYB12_FULL_58_9]
MLTKTEITRLLHALDEELRRASVVGEVYLVGGAVMTLVLNARASTRDLDDFFAPAGAVRVAAARVAAAKGCDAGWLNDAVKGFMSDRGEFEPYLDLENLKVLTAQPEYLLAMKCLSMRIGPEFHDEADVRYLLRYLNVENYETAKEIISRYYRLERFPAKALHALEEILSKV